MGYAYFLLTSPLALCLGREFELYEEQSHRCQLSQGEQQIAEQLKRSLVERARALIQITNASLLGLLQSTPFDSRLAFLSRETEAFTGISRDGVPELGNPSANWGNQRQTIAESLTSVTVHDQHVTFPYQVMLYLRLLGLSLPHLASALEMTFHLEGIDSPNPTFPSSDSDRQRKNALISHTLASIHPSLVSDVTLRAIKLCARICGSMTEAPGLVNMLIKEAKCENIPQESLLVNAFKLVCVEALRFHSFLSQRL